MGGRGLAIEMGGVKPESRPDVLEETTELHYKHRTGRFGSYMNLLFWFTPLRTTKYLVLS